ncbi:MAG TPA: Fe-Mn family superoxide dismutase [Gammaproteobacteria bacterium]|nr:Fe-Mn family superoxide dismutase [Gammaproteobacteria bacterium]
MAIQLPPLPFAMNALQPYLSQETLEYHYGKHHQAYVTNLNNLLDNSPYQDLKLEDIILQSKQGPIFNNAAQVWNHSFYWNCLTPDQGGDPQGPLLTALISKFGSFKKFQEEFTKTAISTFGSGWAWLIQNKDGSLDLLSTSNANTPMTQDKKALLTCDVWEHAYYIDYRNARPKYVENFWKLVNWDFVSQNFK